MLPRGVMVVAPHACWQGNECWQPIGNRPFYVDSFPEMPETTSIWLNSRVSADAKWNRPGQVYLVEAMSRGQDWKNCKGEGIEGRRLCEGSSRALLTLNLKRTANCMRAHRKIRSECNYFSHAHAQRYSEMV
jgi:hypothetical protein